MEKLEIDLKNNLGPLPDGWEETELEDGKMLYIDHTNKITTTEDPRFLDPKIAGTNKKNTNINMRCLSEQ